MSYSVVTHRAAAAAICILLLFGISCGMTLSYPAARAEQPEIVLIAKFSTYYGDSSENRKHNVALAAKAIDGFVLPPEEEFSFNDTVGARTEERGYRTAYISANEIYTSVTLLDKGETDVENVIEQGLRMMGVPYVYGAVRLHDGKGNFIKGFTIKQFDCSSLMQYIFYQGAGVLLNTTTRTQVVQGREVPRTEIRRGDLLFFTNASRYHNTGVERIGHVALYLGENYILHTASDYAVVEPMSPVRQRYFITARRFF